VDPRAWFTCSIEGTYTLDWIAKHERDYLASREMEQEQQKRKEDARRAED
jgi:hypothetical protein